MTTTTEPEGRELSWQEHHTLSAGNDLARDMAKSAKETLHWESGRIGDLIAKDDADNIGALAQRVRDHAKRCQEAADQLTIAATVLTAKEFVPSRY